MENGQTHRPVDDMFPAKRRPAGMSRAEWNLNPISPNDDAGDFFHLPSDGNPILKRYIQETCDFPLLTPEQEIDLAQQIERGKEAELRLTNGRYVDDSEREALQESYIQGWVAKSHFFFANTRLVFVVLKKMKIYNKNSMDLIQEGNIGLMEAVERFDWRQGFRFSTYAPWWIRKTIGKAMHDNPQAIKIPYRISTEISIMQSARDQLRGVLLREPTYQEIAEHLGVGIEKVKDVLQIARMRSFLPLDEYVSDEGDENLAYFFQDRSLSGHPEGAFFATEQVEFIEELLLALPLREARVIEMRYGLNGHEVHKLREIGKKYGLTRERIRQIESEAFKKLRNPRRLERIKMCVDT